MKKRSLIDQAQRKLTTSAEYAVAEVAAAAAETPATSDGAAFTVVPLAAVAQNPRNVRQDLGDLTELAASIAEVGVMEPLVVRPLDDADRAHGYPDGTRYVLVMGGRRLEASHVAEQSTVPVVVHSHITAENERQLMLVENLQREDLHPLDEAQAYQDLVDSGISQRTLAKQIGMTQPHISRRLALLRLDPGIRRRIRENRIGVDVASTYLGKLTADTQAQVVTVLDTIDTSHPTELWVAEQIRSVVTGVERDQYLTRLQEQNQAEAESAGAEVMADDELQARLGPRYYDHQVYRAPDITAAARTGDLLAVATPSNHGPTYYTETPPERTAATTATSTAPTPEAVARKARRDNQKALAQWVQTAAQPGRSDLLPMLARYLVDLMPKEDGALIHKWLRDLDSTAADDYYAWKDALAAGDDPACLRVAWLFTVAHDLNASRYSPDSPAGQRTQDRVREVS